MKFLKSFFAITLLVATCSMHPRTIKPATQPKPTPSKTVQQPVSVLKKQRVA